MPSADLSAFHGFHDIPFILLIYIHCSCLIVLSNDSTHSVAVEAADLIVVDCIVEAGHIADIEEKMDIAGGMHQEKMIDIAVEERDSVDLAQLAGEDS